MIPQFIMTALASVVFALTESNPSDVPAPGTAAGDDGGGDGKPGMDSVVLLFCVGGVAAAIAALLSMRLAADLKRRGGTDYHV